MEYLSFEPATTEPTAKETLWQILLQAPFLIPKFLILLAVEGTGIMVRTTVRNMRKEKAYKGGGSFLSRGD